MRPTAYLTTVRIFLYIPLLLAIAASDTMAQSTALPGTIQVEDFDQGAAGVAYLDTTPGNSGGQYRATDVDIEATSDDGGGHNVGWIVAGEWLAYTVSVGTAGTYDIEIRVASSGSGGRFHIEVNGVDKTGPLTIPGTGGWQIWTTIRRTGVSLSAGQQVWRVVMESNGTTGAVGNLNYLRVTGPAGAGPSPTAFSGSPAALPGTLQIEDFDNGDEGVAYHDLSISNDGGQYRPTGVDIEQTSDSGGGYNVGWIGAGEWLAYTVNVAAAGTYDIEARVASTGAGGTFHVEINGVDRTGPFTVPSTGGWQTWTTVRKTGLTLSAGQQVLRIVMDTNGTTGSVGNINFLRVTSAAGGSASTPMTGTPVALPGLLQAEDFDNGGEGVAYHDLSSGNYGGVYRPTDVDIQATVDTGGGHNVGWTLAGEWLAYTVNVGSAGTYDVEARVASNGTGGTFHIEIGGVDRTGPFTIPNTGGAQTWTTIRKTGLSLNAGQQVWRVVMDTNGAGGAVGNVNHIRVIAATGGGGGTPPPTGGGTALPGTLQAEDFDSGVEGVAYHDLSSGNYGGVYRSTDVDIQATSDTGGGYNVGWTLAGEWLAYTANVTAAGTYDIEARVASNGSGGTFHIEINGANVTGPLSVPNTGGSQTWTTIRRTGVNLSAGQQMWRIVMDTNGSGGAVGNFNYIRVTAPTGGGGGGSGSTPMTGTPAAVPGTVNAEDFDNGGEGVAYHDLSPGNYGGRYRSTDVDIETTTDTGGGYNVSSIVAGEWLVYTVNVTAAGTYDIEARVASNGAGGTFHIEVNGVDRTGPFTVPNTGGWQTWSTIRKTGLSLSAGQQVFRLVTDTNGATGSVGNLNYIRIAGASANQPPTVSVTSPAAWSTYTEPASVTISAAASDSDGSITRVDFFAGNQLIGSDTSSPYSISWGNVGAGTYSLTAVAYDNSGASATSAAVSVVVASAQSAPPTTVVFEPSLDHVTVTSYMLAIYRATDPVTATPVATRNLGKPTPVNNEISVNVSDLIEALPSGSYYGVVSAVALLGTAASAPSPTFTK